MPFQIPEEHLTDFRNVGDQDTGTGRANRKPEKPSFEALLQERVGCKGIDYRRVVP